MQLTKAQIQDVIKLGLQEAKKRFPDQDICFCGWTGRWEDCVTQWFNEEEQVLNVLFQYNVGPATHAKQFKFRDLSFPQDVVDAYMKEIDAHGI
jgi:hypothetical protein